MTNVGAEKTEVSQVAPSAGDSPNARSGRPPSPLMCNRKYTDQRRNRSGSRESHYTHSSCAGRSYVGSEPSTRLHDVTCTESGASTMQTRKRRLDSSVSDDEVTLPRAASEDGRTHGTSAPQTPRFHDDPTTASRSPDDMDTQSPHDGTIHVSSYSPVTSPPPTPRDAVDGGVSFHRQNSHRPSTPPSPIHPHAPHATKQHTDDSGAVLDASAVPKPREQYPCDFNPEMGRTLQIEYWDRTRECKERKWDHLDYIDATFPSREEWILKSVLREAPIVMEPNMFPYNTPRGIEHWTIWSRTEMTIPDVEHYICGWIKAEKPEVRRWNIDVNASRSIDLFHMHVFLQVRDDDDVLPPIEEEHIEDRRVTLEVDDARDGGQEGGVEGVAWEEGRQVGMQAEHEGQVFGPMQQHDQQLVGVKDDSNSRATTSSSSSGGGDCNDEDEGEPAAKRSRQH